MKRTVLIILAALCLAPPSLMAQKPSRFELGGFVDYLLLSQPPNSLSNLGFGGRFDLRIGRKTQLEAEMAYDFPRDFTSTWTANSGAALPFTTHLRTFEGLFGPKFSVGSLYSGRLHPFFTVKAGWINFSANTPLKANFTSDLGAITSGGSAFDVYGGVGVEGFFSTHWGGRFEMGDAIYYSNSAHQNLRVTVGPVFRF